MSIESGFFPNYLLLLLSLFPLFLNLIALVGFLLLACKGIFMGCCNYNTSSFIIYISLYYNCINITYKANYSKDRFTTQAKKELDTAEKEVPNS